MKCVVDVNYIVRLGGGSQEIIIDNIICRYVGSDNREREHDARMQQ